MNTSRNKQKTLHYIPSILLVIFVMIVARYIIPYGFVPSASMEPTLMVGDMDFFNGLAYCFKEVERGDVILFSSKEFDQKMCKRVIGLPNDTITFVNGQVFINDELYDEASYVSGKTTSHLQDSFIVPADSYFLLGDNRLNSYDSRFWESPYIEKTDILGKLMFRIPTGRIVGDWF